MIETVTETENPKALDQAKEIIRQVGATVDLEGALPKGDTSKALRAIAKYLPNSEPGIKAKEYLAPADAHGGIVSFRCVAALSIILVVIFSAMYARDKAQGGYRSESITAQEPPQTQGREQA